MCMGLGFCCARSECSQTQPSCLIACQRQANHRRLDCSRRGYVGSRRCRQQVHRDPIFIAASCRRTTEGRAQPDRGVSRHCGHDAVRRTPTLVALALLANSAGADEVRREPVTRERAAVVEICRLISRGPVDAPALSALLDGTSLSLPTLSGAPMAVTLHVSAAVHWRVEQWAAALALNEERNQGFKCNTGRTKGRSAPSAPQLSYNLQSSDNEVCDFHPEVARGRVTQFSIAVRQLVPKGF
jgi:hypothetical protein